MFHMSQSTYAGSKYLGIVSEKKVKREIIYAIEVESFLYKTLYLQRRCSQIIQSLWLCVCVYALKKSKVNFREIRNRKNGIRVSARVGTFGVGEKGTAPWKCLDRWKYEKVGFLERFFSRQW